MRSLSLSLSLSLFIPVVLNERKATYQPIQAEQSQLTMIADWKQQTTRIYNEHTSRQPLERSSDEEVPADVWLEIFSWLDVRDLASVSIVCLRWNCIANDEQLYVRMLRRLFPLSYVPLNARNNPQNETYKNLFVNAYVRWRRQQSAAVWRTAGMFVCKQCNQFYWGASNSMASCTHSIRTSTYHMEAQLVDPTKIVDALLQRGAPVTFDTNASRRNKLS
jgi:hypothetical protein